MKTSWPPQGSIPCVLERQRLAQRETSDIDEEAGYLMSAIYQLIGELVSPGG